MTTTISYFNKQLTAKQRNCGVSPIKTRINIQESDDLSVNSSGGI